MTGVGWFVLYCAGAVVFITAAVLYAYFLTAEANHEAELDVEGLR